MRHPLAHIPPASTRRLRRGTARAVATLVAVTAGLALAAPAVAHDALVGSDPPADAVLTQAPTQVVLTFAAAQAGVGSEVLVMSGDGTVWSDGPAQVSDVTVTQPLSAALPNGAYTVTWRSVAGDGHPVTGTFAFTVEAPQATPTSSLTPTETVDATETAPEPPATEAAVAVDDPPAPPAEGAPAWVWPVVAAAGLAALAAAALVALRRRATHE